MGNFWAAGIFFRYQIPCMNFFRPLHEYFFGLIGVHQFFFISFSVARIFFCSPPATPPLPPPITFFSLRVYVEAGQPWWCNNWCIINESVIRSLGHKRCLSLVIILICICPSRQRRKNFPFVNCQYPFREVKIKHITSRTTKPVKQLPSIWFLNWKSLW